MIIIWHYMSFISTYQFHCIVQVNFDGAISLTSHSQFIVAWWRHMVPYNLVNIGSGNGVLPAGTKPWWPEPMLTNLQRVLVTLTWGQLNRKCSRYISLVWVWKYQSKITATSPRGQWVNDLGSVKGTSLAYPTIPSSSMTISATSPGLMVRPGKRWSP